MSVLLTSSLSVITVTSYRLKIFWLLYLLGLIIGFIIVKPVLSGHLRDLPKCLLNGVCIIEFVKIAHCL